MITKKWRRMADIYKLFGGDDPSLDYSASAAQAMFEYESKGIGREQMAAGLFRQPPYNGYAVGKHWLNVQIEMWKADIAAGLLLISELAAEYPAWLLKQLA